MANLSKRYADAIYNKDLYSENLKILSDLYNTEEFKNFITNPKITIPEKIEVIKELINSDEIFINFNELLLKEERFSLINNIYDEYMLMLNKENNILEITIISANEITKEEALKISNNFKEMFNASKVNYSIIIDKTIIGGIKVIADGKMYDSSVKTKLNEILN